MTDPNHAIVEVPPLGKEVAREVINYRVGPAVNWCFFPGRGHRKEFLALWGGQLDAKTLRNLGDACFELKQEYKDMDFFEEVRGADKMESNFIHNDYEEPAHD